MWDILSICDVRDKGWKCCAVQHKAGRVVTLVLAHGPDPPPLFVNLLSYQNKGKKINNK